MAFKGWPDAALAFYEGLEADNSKAFWLDHKDVYERDVKMPMEALLAELAGEFGDWRLFRPYRDTRFSRDNTPFRPLGGSSPCPLTAKSCSCGQRTPMLARWRE